MADKIQSVRGMKDSLPEESRKWQYVERVVSEVAESYGYGQLRPPTMEKTNLFVRSVGDTTDIVEKEMYTFNMGSESLTLRPEGTAGTVRAFLQHGMTSEAYPVKLYYLISCFRHEKPQAGRYREFHQFGIEAFGAASALQDAEIIALVDDLLKVLGIKGVEININSIGCPKCRPAYNQKLKDYYAPYIDDMCFSCQDRLERNALRLLDCKEEMCQPTKEKAPRIIDNLCEECDEHFKDLKEALEVMNIKYNINPDIVRGLDYYTKTVFEFITTQIGAQGTICGGGRYDGLVEEMGGPPTAGIGFGMGLERLIMVMEACGSEFPPPPQAILYIGSMGKKAGMVALDLGYKLRSEGFYILNDTVERSVRAQMKYADKQGVGFSCVIGENEIKENKVEIKNMETGEATEVAINAESFAEVLWAKMHEDIVGEDEGFSEILGSLTE